METYDGNKYFLTVVNDFSRMTCLFLLKLKFDMCVVLKQFLSYVFTQFEQKVKIIKSDNGTEFVNFVRASMFEQLGILHQTSCVYTPKQNGVLLKGSTRVYWRYPKLSDFRDTFQ